MKNVNSQPAAEYVANQIDNEEEIIQQALAIVAKRFLKSADPLTNPDLARKYLTLKLSGLQDEVFGCVYLSNQHHVIGDEALFKGTINGASVYPRVVVRECLASNAAAVMFYHNHPSGVAEPSQSDLRITNRLKDALSLVDVRVLDHFIVSAEDSVSLAERGLI